MIDCVSGEQPSSVFNERGVATRRDYHFERAAATAKAFFFSVSVVRLGPGAWIAGWSWARIAGDVEGDWALPSDRSVVHSTKSEAFEGAIDGGLRQISDAVDPADQCGAVELEALRADLAAKLAEIRKGDSELPLFRKVMADICAGGTGSFGLAWSALGGRVGLACEIDEQALFNYKRTVLPESTHGDLCTLSLAGVAFDAVFIGMMCQAFSPAGNRAGFEDAKRATPYKAIVRLVGEVDAKAIVIECAKEFLTSRGGRDATTLRHALMRSGYRVQHRVLNASGFGAPQSRERSFMVATRNGLVGADPLGFMFPRASEPTAVVEDIMQKGLPATIPEGSIAPAGAPVHGRQARMALVGRIDGRDSQGYRVYSPKGLGAALTASGGGKACRTSAYSVPGGARGLTPREAYRMMGAPEWASTHPVKTRALTHAGNAVAVPVAKAIGRGLAEVFGRKA